MTTSQKLNPKSPYFKMTARKPNPAYPTTAQNSHILYGDKELYTKIGEIAQEEEGKSLVEEFEIPIRSGKAWVVRKGKIMFRKWGVDIFLFGYFGDWQCERCW
jgi:uncharacterized protein YcgI (DUF1989 family)